MAKKGKAKRDTGIATLKTGLKIKEELRDELQRHHWQGPRREPEKELTTVECEREKFSGFRANIILQRMELWVLGRIVDQCSLSECTPNRMATMHEKAFATKGTLVDVPMESQKGSQNDTEH